MQETDALLGANHRTHGDEVKKWTVHHPTDDRTAVAVLGSECCVAAPFVTFRADYDLPVSKTAPHIVYLLVADKGTMDRAFVVAVLVDTYDENNSISDSRTETFLKPKRFLKIPIHFPTSIRFFTRA